MALTLGLPTWATGSWATDAWADGSWDVDPVAGSGLVPDLATVYERRRRLAARRDFLAFLRGGR